MNNPVKVALGTAALSLLGASPASAVVERSVEDVSGEVFVCEHNTYTLDGQIRSVFHLSMDGQGRTHVTGTTTTRMLTAVDEDGRVYNVRGAQWFGENQTPNGGVATFTFHLNIVRPGHGVVDSIRVVAHAGPGGSFERDRSTCEA
jgi:hypothetical protein